MASMEVSGKAALQANSDRHFMASWNEGMEAKKWFLNIRSGRERREEGKGGGRGRREREEGEGGGRREEGGGRREREEGEGGGRGRREREEGEGGRCTVEPTTPSVLVQLGVRQKMYQKQTPVSKRNFWHNSFSFFPVVQ